VNLDELKEALSYGCKVLGYQGQTDVIWGHVSLRVPDTDTFIMKSSLLGLEECEPENIVTIDLDGKQVGGTHKMHSEVPIHSEILRVRPDVNSVVHTHPPHATAFSSLNRTLLPVSHEGVLFCDGLPVFSETTDLIRTKEQGIALAKCLGGKNAVLLRNHGIVCVGCSVGEAVMTALILEKACKMQFLVMQMGGPDYWTSPEEARIKRVNAYGVPGDGKLDMAMEFYVRQVKRMEKAHNGII